MAIKRKATSQLQRTKGLDFRCPNDEAWYGVRLLKVKEGVLRVMYLEFPEESDEWYLIDQFESQAQIDDLFQRFRRPAEQLQDSQCGEVTHGMVVLACDTFSNGGILFYDARVDSISRSEHNSNGSSEEQVCNCQFHVTWRDGPEIGKHATVRAENICLIQDLPVDDPVLKEFIGNARKSLERMGNLGSQGWDSGLNPAASSHGASPCPANVPELIDVKFSDGSHHHEEIGQSYEATKPQNKSGGEASTELASKGPTKAQKECVFFWVDNVDEDIEPPQIVKFLQRELSVSSQVMLFPDLFLDNTCSGAIYVESREHAKRVLQFLTNRNNIIVSLKGRPWVTNKKCCGILHCPMPWQEMNLDTENPDDATEIRVLHPGSEGYEEASKMHDLFKAHCDRIEKLKQSLRSEELKLRNTLANGSRSLPHPPK